MVEGRKAFFVVNIVFFSLTVVAAGLFVLPALETIKNHEINMFFMPLAIAVAVFGGISLLFIKIQK